MNQPSQFQAQYPLSPRKFWKKISSRLIVNIIYSIFLEFIALFVVYFIFIKPLVSSGKHIILPMSFWIWLVIGVFLLFYFLLVFIYGIYVKAYIKRYYYDCGEQFITIKKGVFAPIEIHVQYQKIQDVYVDQDILDRIMGLYDVHIASATVTSGIEAHIDGVSADVAENLKNIILGKIHNASNFPNPTQASISQPPQLQSTPIQFSQKISSETYPISGAWIVSAIFSSLVFSIIFSVIFLGILSKLGFVYVLLFLGIVFFFRLIWKSIWKSNFYFEFTPDFILLRTGVISRSENHLPYKSIQNILNSQGIIDRMLGLSTVMIQNAAQQMMSSRGQAVGQSAIALLWQPKAKAEELNNILNDIVVKINSQTQGNNMGL